MSRLIYADDVKKRGDCYPPEVRSAISNILRHTKTIKDVTPVKHGHWEFIGGYGYQYRCSRCINCVERKTKYCPACGCRMDEVSE